MLATRVRVYLEGGIELNDLLSEFDESRDPLVRVTLLALIHEPVRKGAFLRFEKQWQREYFRPLHALLRELDKGDDGTVPAERPVPRTRRRHIVGWFLFVLWAVAGVAEQAVEIWKLVTTESVFPLWRLLFRTLGLVVLFGAALAGVTAVRYRIFLYKSRNDPQQW